MDTGETYVSTRLVINSSKIGAPRYTHCVNRRLRLRRTVVRVTPQCRDACVRLVN